MFKLLCHHREYSIENNKKTADLKNFIKEEQKKNKKSTDGQSIYDQLCKLLRHLSIRLYLNSNLKYVNF
jgi:hypothetical protein